MTSDTSRHRPRRARSASRSRPRRAVRRQAARAAVEGADRRAGGAGDDDVASFPTPQQDCCRPRAAVRTDNGDGRPLCANGRAIKCSRMLLAPRDCPHRSKSPQPVGQRPPELAGAARRRSCRYGRPPAGSVARGRHAPTPRPRRRHDAVVSRDDDQGRQIERSGRTELARHAPTGRAPGSWPRTSAQAFVRDRCGQRHAVVQPILDGDEPPGARVRSAARRSATNLRTTATDPATRRTPAADRPGRSQCRRSPRSAAAARRPGRRPRPRRHGNPKASPAAPGRQGRGRRAWASARPAGRPCSSRAAPAARPVGRERGVQGRCAARHESARPA